jgi:hypothetical protein
MSESPEQRRTPGYRRGEQIIAMSKVAPDGTYVSTVAAMLDALLAALELPVAAMVRRGVVRVEADRHGLAPAGPAYRPAPEEP